MNEKGIILYNDLLKLSEIKKEEFKDFLIILDLSHRYFEKYECLDLSNIKIDDINVINILKKIFVNDFLQEIIAWNFHIPKYPESFLLFLSEMKLTSLRKLDLSFTKIQFYSGDIYSIQPLPHLEELFLRNIDLESKFIYRLLFNDGLFWKLKTLDVSENILSDSLIKKIMLSIRKSNLNTFICEHVKLKDVHVRILSKSIQRSICFKKLCFGFNSLTTHSAKFLGEMIKRSTTLEHLDLKNLQTTLVGMEYLLGALTLNHSVKYLKLDQTSITTIAIQHIFYLVDRKQLDYLSISGIVLKSKTCLIFLSKILSPNYEIMINAFNIVDPKTKKKLYSKNIRT